MSVGTDRMTSLLTMLKQLPTERRSYWLNRLQQTESAWHVDIGPAVISGLVDTRTGKPVEVDNWVKNLAAQWDKFLNTPKDFVDAASLKLANELDKIYQAVAEETGKLVDKAPTLGFALWPLAAAFVAVMWAYKSK